MNCKILVATLLFAILSACASPSLPASSQAPPAHTKRIALTFDDVPRQRGAYFDDEERTSRLIAELQRAGVEQAAFFLNPGRIADSPGAEVRIARYVAAGHVIANHSANHPHLSSTTAADYLDDIDAAEVWLQGREGYRPWFRFPFLDEGRRDKVKRDAVRAGLAKRGLRNGYVTAEASDWFYENAVIEALKDGKDIDRDALRNLYVESHVEAAETFAAVAERTLDRQPAHVMLLHETDLNALYIADMVAALEAKGWQIITADEAYADPIGTLMSDTPSAQGTLTEALAWERGLTPPRWYERNDTELAGRLFRIRVLGEVAE